MYVYIYIYMSLSLSLSLNIYIYIYICHLNICGSFAENCGDVRRRRIRAKTAQTDVP